MGPRPLLNCLPQLRRATLLRDGGGLTDGQLLGEFIRAGDESAFAALVKRHAAMVFGVCRRLVGDVHIAEDAFQAAFLVLARRATSIRPREQVGNWLYGVAVRVALKAKSQLARRRSKEKQVHAMPHPEVQPVEIWHDVQLVLDEELARLPDKLRTPVVLCDLEGRTQREVARQLSLPLATLTSRLQSARKLLAQRLGQRGIVLSGGALATAISANAARASVPPLLVSNASRMAGAAATGSPAVGVSAQVLQLSEGVMRMMIIGKLRSFVCCLAATLVLAGGTLQLAAKAAEEPKEPVRPKTPSAALPEESKPSNTKLDDREYLRRVCLQFRGQTPTAVENGYFLSDSDRGKRAKIVEWLIAEKDEKARKERELASSICNRDAVADRIIAVLGDKTQILADGSIRSKPEAIKAGAWDSYFAANSPISKIAGCNACHSQAPNAAEKSADGKSLGDKPEKPETRAAIKALLLQSKLAKSEKLEPDFTFLDRVCREARGTPATHLEIEYFKADGDPKKREKLLDMFLGDPTLAKKLGNEWKRKMLKSPETSAVPNYHAALTEYYTLYGKQAVLLAAQQLQEKKLRLEAVSEKLLQLIDQVLKEGRTDAQILEALSIATIGRLPTETEKTLALANIATVKDKHAAWRKVLTSLSTTDEAKRHAAELSSRQEKTEKK